MSKPGQLTDEQCRVFIRREKEFLNVNAPFIDYLYQRGWRPEPYRVSPLLEEDQGESIASILVSKGHPYYGMDAQELRQLGVEGVMAVSIHNSDWKIVMHNNSLSTSIEPNKDMLKKAIQNIAKEWMGAHYTPLKNSQQEFYLKRNIFLHKDGEKLNITINKEKGRWLWFNHSAFEREVNEKFSTKIKDHRVSSLSEKYEALKRLNIVVAQPGGTFANFLSSNKDLLGVEIKDKKHMDIVRDMKALTRLRDIGKAMMPVEERRKFYYDVQTFLDLFPEKQQQKVWNSFKSKELFEQEEKLGKPAMTILKNKEVLSPDEIRSGLEFIKWAKQSIDGFEKNALEGKVLYYQEQLNTPTKEVHRKRDNLHNLAIEYGFEKDLRFIGGDRIHYNRLDDGKLVESISIKEKDHYAYFDKIRKRGGGVDGGEFPFKKVFEKYAPKKDVKVETAVKAEQVKEQVKAPVQASESKKEFVIEKSVDKRGIANDVGQIGMKFGLNVTSKPSILTPLQNEELVSDQNIKGSKGR